MNMFNMDLLVMNTPFTNVCSNEIQHDLLIMIEGVVSDFMKGFVLLTSGLNANS